ncbi:MAG: AAA family ATPase [Chitinophagaceae bacterium]|nr:AAA family ATPase [Chitinophagaceae bacterium]MCW5925795.1 AAA family ATPase [Chitinophagaceae bacterium]
MLKKVVIIGPESTGKSTLSRQLANHYGASWCPEYAREYLLQHGTDYTFENLLTIAHGQLALEEKYTRDSLSSRHRVLFIDTDMYVMKVWCEFVFGKCHHWILDQIVSRKYDLYLLCNIDIPWVKDELREYPDLLSRQKLYHMYRDILINQPTPWADIRGGDEERFIRAKNAVDVLLQSYPDTPVV